MGGVIDLPSQQFKEAAVAVYFELESTQSIGVGSGNMLKVEGAVDITACENFARFFASTRLLGQTGKDFCRTSSK